MQEKIKIGIPSNERMHQASLDVLYEAGYHFTRNGRDFSSTCANDSNIEAFFVRYNDIPNLVSSGRLHCGITTNAMVDETDNMLTGTNLDFSHCKLVLAALPHITSFEDLDGKVVATSYPNLAKNFFMLRQSSIAIDYAAGGLEVFPKLGYDAIIDITQTGASLKANGLEIIYKVMNIQAVFIYNTQGTKKHIQDGVRDIHKELECDYQISLK